MINLNDLNLKISLILVILIFILSNFNFMLMKKCYITSGPDFFFFPPRSIELLSKAFEDFFGKRCYHNFLYVSGDKEQDGNVKVNIKRKRD